MEPAADAWSDACSLDELSDRRKLRVTVDEEFVLLVKGDDQIWAIGNQCTHQGAGLDKGVVNVAGSVKTVTCPAHGSTFNLETGKVMRPPASKPVPVYDVKVEDGRVFVRPRAEA
jgi:nitrite reductase/ring-hydroxylating ferredoxin subunit